MSKERRSSNFGIVVAMLLVGFLVGTIILGMVCPPWVVRIVAVIGSLVLIAIAATARKRP